jgi:hypothetical protein
MKFSDFPQAVVNENVDWTVREITNVIKRYGPRESGNENCLAVLKHIKKEMSTFCDETKFEDFEIAPKAFLLFTKVVSLIFIIATVVPLLLVYLDVFDNIQPNVFFIPQIIAGSAALLAIIIAFVQVGLYIPFGDIFHKKHTAQNFYAVRKPKGEVKKRIIISGHVDAAFEWRHIMISERAHLMFPLMGFTIFSAAISVIVCVLSIIASFKNLGGFGNFLVDYGFYFHMFTVLGMIFLFLFVDFDTVSPGANDNLTGTYAAVCAIRMLDMAGVELENTEVVALITDGEEAGLRGAKAWAKAHKEELTNGDVETVVLCAETFGDMDYFKVYNRDMNSLVAHDKEFSAFVKEAGKDADYDMKYGSIFMGSSDATAFTQEGIKCCTIAAMNPWPADYYHNRRDNADRLDSEVIKAGFDVVLSTILKFDEE